MRDCTRCIMSRGMPPPHRFYTPWQVKLVGLTQSQLEMIFKKRVCMYLNTSFPPWQLPIPTCRRHYAECCNAEFRYTDFRYAGCPYAECRDADHRDI